MMSTVNAELYGMRHRRAFTVLPIVWLLQIVLFAYVANFIVAMTVEDLSGLQREAMLASLTTESASAAVLGSLPMYGAPVLIILGALMAAGDERSGILRLTVSRVPERGTVLTGKITALLLLVSVVIVLSVVTAAVCAIVISLIEGTPMRWDLSAIVTETAASWLIASAWAMMGFMLGIVTRSLAASIAIGVLWALVLEQMVHGLAAVATALAPVRVGLISGASAVLADAAGIASMPGGVPDAPVSAAIAVLVAWTVVSGAVATVVFRARDIR